MLSAVIVGVAGEAAPMRSARLAGVECNRGDLCLGDPDLDAAAEEGGVK